jgi:hypothetical protein
MAQNSPKISFKAGDDFLLSMVVTDKTTEAALSTKAELDEAQLMYDIELQNPSPNEVTLASLLSSLDAARVAYETAIIVDISNWTIAASLVWINRLVTDFTVTKTNAPQGEFILEAPWQETQTWKPRVYCVDVQFIINGKKSSSMTFAVDVEQDITFERDVP